MITPQDIQSKQFHVRFRGFDVDEVDVFLERVAEDMLTLIQENKMLREKNEEILRDMDSFKQQSRTFQEAIVSAQKIADEMKAKSKEEATQIIQRAKGEAQQLHEQATREITELERQVDELKALRGRIREELLQVLEKTGNHIEEIFGRTAPPAERPRRELPEERPAPAAPAAATLQPAPAAPKVQVMPVAAAPEPEPSSEPAAKADTSELPAPDLSDLYTSIHIEEDLASPPPLPIRGGAERAPAVELDLEEETGLPHDVGPLPDFDGDMSFSLEDPLDMEPERAGSRKKKR